MDDPLEPLAKRLVPQDEDVPECAVWLMKVGRIYKLYIIKKSMSLSQQ